jgi:hypothetical protein
MLPKPHPLGVFDEAGFLRNTEIFTGANKSQPLWRCINRKNLLLTVQSNLIELLNEIVHPILGSITPTAAIITAN